MIAKYAHTALGPYRKMNGPHVFRRRMGWHLLETGIPPPMICDVMAMHPQTPCGNISLHLWNV